MIEVNASTHPFERRPVQAILDSIPEAFVAFDAEWRYSYVNLNAERLLGKTRKELLGRCVWEAYPEAVGTVFHLESHRAVAENIPVHYETFSPSLGIWLDVYLSPSSNDLYVYLQDISEKKRQEDTAERRQDIEALKASEPRFREMAENIRDVFWMSRPEGRERTGRPESREILYVSPAYETIWGRSCASLYQNPLSWTEAIHPSDKKRILSLRAEQAGGGYDVEYRIVRADGSLRWIHDRAFPIRNEQGEIYRFAGVAEDITERKLSEEALRTSYALNRVVLRSLTARIAVIDRSGTITAANEAWEQFAQTHEKAAPCEIGVGANYLEVCRRKAEEGAAEGDAMLNGLQSVLEGAQTHFALEYSRCHMSQPHWFLMNATFVPGKHGGAVVSHTDITLRKLAEREMIATVDDEG